MNAILLRDSGKTLPKLEPMKKKYNMKIASIVDMPVEIGISVLGMKTLEAGAINDYETKAFVTVDNLEYNDGIYVHLKGPDEFGHDGDAQGKKRSIEDIDTVFFGTKTLNEKDVFLWAVTKKVKDRGADNSNFS